MIQRYDFAPLDGITKAVYRRVWARRFGGADRLFIPYFSPTREHIVTKRERVELAPPEMTDSRTSLGGDVTAPPRPCRPPERGEMSPQGDRGGQSDAAPELVPQVMTNTARELLWAAEVVRDLGYTELNLNLGCPSGTITAKTKGAGLLARTDTLQAMLDGACDKLCLPLSVKARIGYESPDEFPALLDLFNRYPLKTLILHVRVRKDKYSGPLYYDAFADALRDSVNPVEYNGDLRTVAEVDAFAGRFPGADAVMIGRGGIADPALFRKLKGGAPASRDELRAFTAELFDEYTRFYDGQVGHAAQRMREVWFYLIHLFDDNRRLNKAMRRFRTTAEYRAAEDAIFAELPLRTDSAGDLI